jgi:hypothetical protein
VKAIFGGAVKKPLMTKVSMRHLNELVRERNQYSRDALEAWQDFINLKGRMDTELSKVTKRNNFLVEELESWKQQVNLNLLSAMQEGKKKEKRANGPVQFLKFQAFAEQLTKETQDLKVKIENHKRENRRLTTLIDQQKDDAARLTVRLSGTEKQRDDALEALVLQQEIAEELERERKRNKKELSALQHTISTLTRQRDESQRVVLHLRSLIDGQAHHMEHIVRSLSQAPELSEYLEEGFEDVLEEEENVNVVDKSEVGTITGVKGLAPDSRSPSRSYSRASTIGGRPLDGEDVSPEMENRFFNNPLSAKRFSQLSVADVADRHLRDKTDAIADIIRNISEQCAAAVEGLHLAQDADNDDYADSKRRSLMSPSEDGEQHDHSEHGGHGMNSDDNENSGFLNPQDNSSIPPTPDLVHRSSTSMSMASASTSPDRQSQQYSDVDVPTKIVEDDDEQHEQAGDEAHEQGVISKQQGDSLIRRPAGARISALGQVGL